MFEVQLNTIDNINYNEKTMILTLVFVNDQEIHLLMTESPNEVRENILSRIRK